jgi:hypothetical protein
LIIGEHGLAVYPFDIDKFSLCDNWQSLHDESSLSVGRQFLGAETHSLDIFVYD